MRKIIYFLAVANYGNINKAAKHLGLQPSTLTKSIKRQEEEIGVLLFERHPKGMSLTADGKIFHRFASNVQREMQYVQQELGVEKRQVIKILFGMACPHFPFIEYLIKIQTLFPHVYFVIETKMFTSLNSEDRDQYDMIIGGITSDFITEDQGVKVFFHITDIKTKIYASINHPLQQKENLSWAEVNEYPWVIFFRDHTLKNILLSKSKKNNLPPPKLALEVSSVTFTKETLISGEHYLAALPHPCQGGQIKDIDYPELRYLDIGLLYNLRLKRFPFFQSFLKLLKETQNPFK